MRLLPRGQFRYGVDRRVSELFVGAVTLPAGSVVPPLNPFHRLTTPWRFRLDALSIEGAVQDPEGHVDAHLRHPLGGFLLLLQHGVGDEVGHLEQVVVLGASEGRATDDSL